MVALDGLRALALFGALVINLSFGFRVPVAQGYLPVEPLGEPERSLYILVVVLVEHKAIAILSLLFGAGLAIQLERLAGDPLGGVRLVRRQLVLLVLGAAHLLLFWSGDILGDYAIAGLIALPFLLAPVRILGIVAAFLVAAGPVLAVAALAFGIGGDDWFRANATRAVQIYREGSFGSIVAFRVEEAMARLPYYATLLPWTLGMLLLGAFFWRAGLMELAQRGSPIVIRAAVALLAVGLALSALAYLELVPVELPDDARLLVWTYGSIVMALGYAGLVLSRRGDRARRWLGYIAPLGRMALTAYISQSVIMGLIFHAYGLGAVGKLDLFEGLAVVVAIYGAQLIVARWWLAHFRHGPLEWLWRSLAHGRRLPLRQSIAV